MLLSPSDLFLSPNSSC
uniref:Uncharacterized protein n=1 Tax=Arundo donax TaxID=35708 RepID=A0A0A9ANW3_ARUDO